jgi:thiamine pyrophosphokinase
MPDEIVLILGNGIWGEKETIGGLMRQVDVVIAVDGGWGKANNYDVPVDVVIGDLDSLAEKEREDLERTDIEVLTYPKEKDRSDFEIALDYAISLVPQKILLYGMGGGRLDHNLVNLFLLEKVVRKGISIEIVAEAERTYLVKKSLNLTDAAIGDLVSLLPLTASVEGVRTKGLKYALLGETLRRVSSRGISNRVSALPVRVELKRGLLFVVHAPVPNDGG